MMGTPLLRPSSHFPNTATPGGYRAGGASPVPDYLGGNPNSV